MNSQAKWKIRRTILHVFSLMLKQHFLYFCFVIFIVKLSVQKDFISLKNENIEFCTELSILKKNLVCLYARLKVSFKWNNQKFVNKGVDREVVYKISLYSVFFVPSYFRSSTLAKSLTSSWFPPDTVVFK